MQLLPFWLAKKEMHNRMLCLSVSFPRNAQEDSERDGALCGTVVVVVPRVTVKRRTMRWVRSRKYIERPSSFWITLRDREHGNAEKERDRAMSWAALVKKPQPSRWNATTKRWSAFESSVFLCIISLSLLHFFKDAIGLQNNLALHFWKRQLLACTIMIQWSRACILLAITTPRLYEDAFCSIATLQSHDPISARGFLPTPLLISFLLPKEYRVDSLLCLPTLEACCFKKGAFTWLWMWF